MPQAIDWFVLTEKPDQARKFEKALELNNGSSPHLDGLVKVGSARGRLFDFAKPEEQNEARYSRDIIDNTPQSVFSVANDKRYKSDRERLENMPVFLNTRLDGKIKYRYSDNKTRQIGEGLKKDLLAAQHIIIATDWDVAGELVFNDLVVNYELEDQLDWDQVFRAQVTALDPKSILESLTHLVAYQDAKGSGLKEIEAMVARGYARSIVDYEFGYTFSFYNEVLQRQLGLQFKGGLGRLKLSVLNAILNQENQIALQDLRPTYQLQLVVNPDFALTLPFVFHSEEDAEKKAGLMPTKALIKTKTGRKTVPAPDLFDRTSYIVQMDQLASIDWGRALQQAYETYSTVSYPRTANPTVSMRLFKELRSSLDDPFIQKLLQDEIQRRGFEDLAFDKLKPRHQYVDDGAAKTNAHHAIVPVGGVTAFDLDAMEAHGDKRAREAYLQILYHTMAMFAENGVEKGQQIQFVDQNGQIFFKTVLQQTLELGWRKLIDGPVHQDVFYEGEDQVLPIHYEIIQSETEVLHRFTHAELLSYLNQAGIGTESTREPVMNELRRIKMVVVDQDGGYAVNPIVAQILRVIRKEGFLSDHDLALWDKELEFVHNMHDAVRFIQARRVKLEDINKKVQTWYDANE